jgi:hypothetical protein
VIDLNILPDFEEWLAEIKKRNRKGPKFEAHTQWYLDELEEVGE